MSATAFETISVSHDDRVATIRFERPDNLNAISMTMGKELHAALETIAAGSDTRAVILTGAGRGFSSGADLKSMEERPLLPSGRPDLGYLLEEVYNPTILLMREMPQPIVAAVNGVAAGIGCSFALACDYIVAARSASFLLAFVNVALVPDGGSSLLVPARAGLSRGLEMALLGDKVPAEKALAWNLVNDVADDEQLMETANAVAARFAAGPPDAYGAIKALFNETYLEDLRAQLQREADAQRIRSDSDEVVEATMAFFQKRRPEFP